MGVLYQVNGPAVVYIGSSAPGGRAALGIARDRIRITINHYDSKITADNGGSHVPVDVQNMGKDAVIRMSLAQHDPAVLAQIEQRGASSPGALGPIGLPLGASGNTFKLMIPSNYLPWTFYNCVLRPRTDAISTEFSLIDLEFYAFAGIGSLLDASTVKLFDNVF